MKAAMVKEYGPPETLVIEELPDPEPGPSEVLVDVHAASVNFPDVLIMQNLYQISVPTPFAPGSEIAGVVRAVGAEVKQIKPGDRVFGTMMVGAFSEAIVIPEASLTHIPDGVDFGDAAAFHVVYATSYNALKYTARLKEGETLAVLGAAGGVGLAAVEIGKLLGARVIAAASSAEKLEVCKAHGADALINYQTENLKDRLKELTDGRGVDVVYDPVGGDYSEQALRATGWNGRFIIIGFATGDIPRIPLNLVLLKGCWIGGFAHAAFGANEPEESAQCRAELQELFAAGDIRPHISARFPLEQAGDALRLVAERKSIGKVVIDIR